MLSMTLLFIGTTEIIVIAAIILLIFGGKKLPELMRGLGKGMKEFKEGMRDVEQEVKNEESAQPVDPQKPMAEPQPEDEPIEK